MPNEWLMVENLLRPTYFRSSFRSWLERAFSILARREGALGRRGTARRALLDMQSEGHHGAPEAFLPAKPRSGFSSRALKEFWRQDPLRPLGDRPRGFPRWAGCVPRIERDPAGESDSQRPDSDRSNQPTLASVNGMAT